MKNTTIFYYALALFAFAGMLSTQQTSQKTVWEEEVVWAEEVLVCTEYVQAVVELQGLPFERERGLEACLGFIQEYPNTKPWIGWEQRLNPLTLEPINE